MWHAETMHAAELESANSDRPPEAAAARIERFDRSIHAHGYDPETPNAVEAAREVLRWYHGRLLTLWPGRIDPELAYRLTVWRDVALLALIDHGTGGFAKREQLQLTNGRPLGICTGGGEPTLIATDWRPLQVWPVGCFFVFEEATNISGKKWPRLCPDCQPRNGHRNPYRAAKRAARARVKTFLAGRT